ncbi:MAG: hypothetical protein JSR73_09465 [Proteobacteria bacterium]|nr:hypothetical protein [Pseudomonadota bacterium]
MFGPLAGRFAEAFGPDEASQRAEIARLLKIGRPRKDSLPMREALRALVIDANGKPRRREPERIARILDVDLARVEDWLDDFRGAVNRLIEASPTMPRALAWQALKGALDSDGAAIERGIARSRGGRNAGASSAKARKRVERDE